MVKKRNKYTAEFKQEAVGLVMEHGYSYADAGRSLSVLLKLKSAYSVCYVD